MGTVNLRLNGSAEAIDAMVEALRGMRGVDHVLELGVAGLSRERDDSSSTGTPDDAPSGATDIEVEAVSDSATDAVRERAEILARNAGVVLEWLDPF